MWVVFSGDLPIFLCYIPWPPGLGISGLFTRTKACGGMLNVTSISQPSLSFLVRLLLASNLPSPCDTIPLYMSVSLSGCQH